MQDSRFKHARFAAPVAVSAFLATQALPANAQFKPCPGLTGSDVPCLKIDIPTIPTLSQVKRIKGTDTDTLVVPFLAEYINGVYQFGLYAAVTVAGVMAVIGGFQWLTAGDSGRVSEAKERITNAVIGVVLALSAYTILNTVDPRITKLSGLSISVVKQESLDDNLLSSTTDTSSGAVKSGGKISGTFSPTGQCPFTLTVPATPGAPNWDQVNEFETLAKQQLGGLSAEEKMLNVGDWADACGVNMGACGLTVGRLRVIAGISTSDTCRNKITDSCWGQKIDAIDITMHRKIRDILCSSKTASEDCISDAGQAPGRVRAMMKEANIPGWPDEWVRKLKPGDTVVLYNGNSTGTHSMMFAGMGADGKSIQIIDGSSNRNVHVSSYCVMSACGDNQAPILKTFR